VGNFKVLWYIFPGIVIKNPTSRKEYDVVLDHTQRCLFLQRGGTWWGYWFVQCQQLVPRKLHRPLPPIEDAENQYSRRKK
jgi:hypothetical protein